MTATSSSVNINGVDKQALDATIEALRETPVLAKISFALNSEWLDGCHQRSTTGDLHQNGELVSSRTASYVLESDEPAALLGTDKAASPAEYILQALAGCYAVTYATNAAVRGIELSSLRLEMQTDVDLQGFLNLDDAVRPGLQEIRINVHAESPNSTSEQLQALTEAVQKRSPIRDTLANPVHVVTTLVK
ncbi:OsmC family protein [Rhodococcus sp. (in: high G+C Gram-positive bacteria)]|uniref:OsmC family protein n=1 Tax=Rhodococcus sp. TaxID=1831 RepID=UPI00257F8671|nr:OsmC family protein [Rhodococcus sp. (in: high G+C Gram-positive bacteria)]MBQ9055536.1 OsmC family protein [Rhodococcus sp. (in: high G+C Gram-positive bacteria)]